jgi:hypothetical protein
MKKILWTVPAIIMIAIGSIYVFIPSTITISNVRYVTAYHETVLKFLTNTNKLENWLQTVAIKKGNTFNYKGYNYTIDRALTNIVELNISSDKVNLKSNIISLHIYLDSSAMQWSTELNAGNNPVSRMMTYAEAKKLKESMSGLMNEMKKFLDNPVNMYGINVKETQVRDSVVLTTRFKTSVYPTTEEIYKQIDILKSYAMQQAAITNAPMLYINKVGENNYEAMVGLPINKVISQTNEIRIKRMPYGGNMFVTEIKGGNYSIDNGIKKLAEYFNDSKRVTPAIPYQLMITDRLKEADTTRWITRLYYPIM